MLILSFSLFILSLYQYAILYAPKIYAFLFFRFYFPAPAFVLPLDSPDPDHFDPHCVPQKLERRQVSSVYGDLQGLAIYPAVIQGLLGRIWHLIGIRLPAQMPDFEHQF